MLPGTMPDNHPDLRNRTTQPKARVDCSKIPEVVS